MSFGGGAKASAKKKDIQRVNLLIGRLAARLGHDLCWASIQVNVNLLSGWHIDDSKGLALVIVGGDFTGGALEIRGVGSFDLQGQALVFDQGSDHRVCAFQGYRWSVVAFTHSDSSRPGAAREALELRSLGFRPSSSDLPSSIPPTRARISKEFVG